MATTPIKTPTKWVYKPKWWAEQGKGFDKKWQPSPESKKAGREKRRKEMQMQEIVLELLTIWLNEKSLEEMKKEYYENKDGKLVPRWDKKPIDHIIASYIMKSIKDPNMMKDIINRYVWYAPSKMELTGKNGEDFKNPVVNVIVQG